MYKHKLFYFGLTIAFILLVSLICTAISANLTLKNLKQNSIAQSLLIEHQKLSSISYRLFKQLTDELIFGGQANQAHVRNKQVIIQQSLDTIRKLEIEQRNALGAEITQGSVEDTDELEILINQIIDEFKVIISKAGNNTPLNEQETLQRLLEVTIDNEFREAINAAVTRQSKVAAAINARIDTLNKAIMWFNVGLAILSFVIILYGCYWLFNQLYQPLMLINNATKSITSGVYDKPISEKLDNEFNELATSINKLAKKLKEHEEFEASSRKQLEYEVEQRTSELTSANLELTKTDSRRRQFIADISHELRTPLTIIRGEAQVTLRLQAAKEEDYKQTLSAILDQSIGLSALVDDLLLLTRAEMNQLNLQLCPIKISKLIETEVSKWRRLHTNREFIITLDNKLLEASLFIDSARIQQVISILIDNAIKYSPEDYPINIMTQDNENTVSILVTDKGIGISATEIENIFERFVRFRKDDEGLGLGLTIAKAITEAHGGKIVVTSNQGEGATFSIVLPKEKLS